MVMISGQALKSEIGTSIQIKPFRKGNLGGVSYDITLGDEFLKLRDDEVALIDPDDLHVVGERTVTRDFILQPDSFVLARSEEWMQLDGTVMALMSGKSGLARLGLQVHSAAVLAPGHSGYIVLEIKNNNNVPFRLVKGMKIAQILFFRTEKVAKYSSLKNSTFKTQRTIELPDKLSFSD